MILASNFVRDRFVQGSAIGAAVVLLLAAPARAEDAETRTAARDLATQGGQAFDAGHYEQASDFFLRAYELVQAPSIALMRARSLAQLGQLVEAIDAYEQTAHVKLPAGAPDAYVKAVEAAHIEAEAVRRRAPRLKLTLTNVGANQALRVTIDDKPTPSALLGVDRPMNPGAHRVALLVSGQTRATREFSLEEGESYSVELDAAQSVADNPTNAPQKMLKPTSLAPETASRRESSALLRARTLAYLGVGVGVVGLGLGTYTGLVALHHKSRLDDACHPGCPESSAQDLSGFRDNRTASWLSYGVGVAALTSGVLWLTLGDPKREHVALGLTPGGVQIGGRL
jgi:hypothetical protein